MHEILPECEILDTYDLSTIYRRLARKTTKKQAFVDTKKFRETFFAGRSNLFEIAKKANPSLRVAA